MSKRWIFLFYSVILLVIIYLYFFNPITSEFIHKYVPFDSIFAFLIFYFTTIIISQSAKYFYSQNNKIPIGKKNNVHFGIENIARFVIGAGLFITFLSVIGIDPKELITSLTIVAAAFAILTKEYIVDFLSGIYLSFSNTFEVNDYVKLDNHKGKIVEISMLKVKILNDDDDIVIIPNTKVHYGEIINYTKRDARLMTVDFQIAIKHVDSIEQLEKDIKASLEGISEYIDPESYNLKIVEMKMDYLALKFQYTLLHVDMDLQRRIRKQTIREVFNYITSKDHMQSTER